MRCRAISPTEDSHMRCRAISPMEDSRVRFSPMEDSVVRSRARAAREARPAPIPQAVDSHARLSMARADHRMRVLLVVRPVLVMVWVDQLVRVARALLLARVIRGDRVERRTAPVERRCRDQVPSSLAAVCRQMRLTLERFSRDPTKVAFVEVRAVRFVSLLPSLLPPLKVPRSVVLVVVGRTLRFPMPTKSCLPETWFGKRCRGTSDKPRSKKVALTKTCPGQVLRRRCR